MFKLTLIACGNKMPAWVDEAVKEYTKRLKEYLTLSIVEIPLIKRTKNTDLSRIMDKESALMIAAIPNGSRVVALEIEGESFSSEKLAVKFEMLQQINSHLCLLVGGPEGLTANTLARCDEKWSLSPLTLPHPMVRIILFEAVYRAWAILNNHPYHK